MKAELQIEFRTKCGEHCKVDPQEKDNMKDNLPLPHIQNTETSVLYANRQI